MLEINRNAIYKHSEVAERFSPETVSRLDGAICGTGNGGESLYSGSIMVDILAKPINASTPAEPTMVKYGVNEQERVTGNLPPLPTAPDEPVFITVTSGQPNAFDDATEIPVGDEQDSDDASEEDDDFEGCGCHQCNCDDDSDDDDDDDDDEPEECDECRGTGTVVDCCDECDHEDEHECEACDGEGYIHHNRDDSHEFHNHYPQHVFSPVPDQTQFWLEQAKFHSEQVVFWSEQTVKHIEAIKNLSR